jgi:Protein of unknown function (DUF2586)
MTQPNVTITELDGALGVLPPTSGALFAIVGPCSSGPFDTPAAFARIKDIQANFTNGPAVEAAAHYIERYGRAVLFVRCNANVAAAIGAVDDDGVAGTSVVTATGTPTDDVELVVKIVNGGTIGVAGITYQLSADGGRSFGPITGLGTATTLVAPDSLGVTFHFAAGTLLAADTWSTVVTSATWNSADIQTALAALKVSQQFWELVQIVGPIDASTVVTIDAAVAGMATAGKYKAWVGNTRIPAIGESESTYATALAGFAADSSKYGSLYAGGCKLTSSVSGRRYRRPPSFATGAREASVSQEIDIADPNLDALPGVTIRDVNGNPDEHDETANPGLDDSRFAVLRTWDGFGGVYVNRPRLFSPAGSDFQLMPHRRVMNITHDALRVYFIRRLNKPVLVSKTTGFILEADASEIEKGALAVMRATLMAKPKASAVQFVLSRTDNLLSTRTLTGQARIVPLAYPEFVTLDLGFFNPALQLVAA